MQTKNNKKNEELDLTNTSADRFVVLRNGVRVSDEEFTDKDSAQKECSYWQRVVDRWPDGSKIEIVNLNKRNSK